MASMNLPNLQGVNLEETKKLLSNTFKHNTHTIYVWSGFLSVSFIVYFVLSSGDFSFLLTYAAFMRCFGFCVLNYRMWSVKSAKGISVKTLEIYMVTFVVRLLSIMRHQGYLPFDKTGDWFYHAVECMSLVSVAVAIYGVFGPLISTYDEKYDKFGNLHVPNEFGIVFLVAPCIIFAIIMHPNLNREWFSDTCWALSMYLEAVAMIPQIYMFQHQARDLGGVLDAMIGHTVFALGFSRVFELIFWVGSFKELADASGSKSPGYIVLFSQLGHLVIMGDFFYYYLKSLSKGLPMELPTHNFNSYV